MEKTPLPNQILNHLPWDQTSSSLWPLSSFSIRRNLACKAFPSKQSESELKQVFDLVFTSLKKMPLFKEAFVIDLSTLTQEDRLYIFEHFFLSDELYLKHGYEMLVVSYNCQVIIGINLSDHILIHTIDSKNKWHKMMALCFEIEKHLANDLEFAFSKKFGYLTEKTQYAGLGLSIKAYLHLPILLEKYRDDLSNLETDPLIKISEITPQNTEEPLTKFHGDLLVLENTFQLGVFEEQLLKIFYKEINHFIDSESSLRLEMKSQKPSFIKDRISRAFGLLKHGYQIPTNDALESLSYLKLGIDLGFVKGIEDHQINDMFFVSRRSHLMTNGSKSLSLDELSQKRALYFHEKIQGVSLDF